MRQPGVLAALGAALLFGGSTPLAKWLLASVDPWLPAGLLYLGSGGALAYDVSLALFVVGLRNLGTARTGAYFSVAPFFGALLAIPLFGEALDQRLLIAGALIAVGVWLHLTEHHRHDN